MKHPSTIAPPLLAAALLGAGCVAPPSNHCSSSFRDEVSIRENNSVEGQPCVPIATKSELIAKQLDEMVQIPGQDFEIAKHEVTQALWEAVMGNNPSKFKGGNLPVESVSWFDCQKFIEALNSLPEVRAASKPLRLPLNREWEIACRAGSDGDYCRLADGTEITEETLDKVAWFKTYKTTNPVGQKLPNAFGLYDMHGNVWEWTASRMINLNLEALPHQAGPFRSICGGGFDEGAQACCSYSHYMKSGSHRSKFIGLRLAR